MHTQLLKLSSKQRIASFPSGFSYKACHKISHLQLYLSIYKSISPFSIPAATYCHLQTCPQGPRNKSNKNVSLPSFSPKYFTYLSSRCWEGLHPFPLFRHQPIGEKKNGLNYILNYFSSCLRP